MKVGNRTSDPERLFQAPIPAAPFDDGAFDVIPTQPVVVLNSVLARNPSEYVLVTAWSK